MKPFSEALRQFFLRRDEAISPSMHPSAMIKSVPMSEKLRYIFLLAGFFSLVCSFSQSSDEQVIRLLFDNALESRAVYNNLNYLCSETPGRLLGSEASLKALRFMEEYMTSIHADTVFLQSFSTPAWRCHQTEVSLITSDGRETRLRADALGPSPSTPEEGLITGIVEVQGLEELEALDSAFVAGKIVFFSRPVNRKLISTFRIYGSGVDQRFRGPALAVKKGAAGVLVRSVTPAIDTFPHTGSTRFDGDRVPCAAISTIDADILTNALRQDSLLKIRMIIDSEDFDSITSYNLIADIRGAEFPDEYIVAGGHIDAWFNSPGAHDDGAGCVMTADVLRIFRETGIRPRHSIRVVLFMDEELYQSGGNAYAAYTKEHQIRHILAMEADAGGFTPEGFMVDAPDSVIRIFSGFQPLLEPYGIRYIRKGGSGVDINPLKEFGVPLMGYRTDSQRYMDLHHAATDTFDKIHIRELQLGAGCMAAMIWLADRYDWP